MPAKMGASIPPRRVSLLSDRMTYCLLITRSQVREFIHAL